jgi:ATP-dependent Clp protease ATP-binding subunit ClpA
VPGGQRLADLALEAANAATPMQSLRTARELRREFDAFERRQVARALADGASFGDIARALGVSRQAAHRRFRELAPAPPSLATTAEARLVLGYARQEALALGAGTPGGEHILLASLRPAAGPTAAVLRSAGASLEGARALIADPSAPRPQALADAELRAALAGAAREARERGDGRIDVAHLLIGALDDPDGGAVRTLRALNVEIERLRAELVALLDVPSVNSG